MGKLAEGGALCMAAGGAERAGRVEGSVNARRAERTGGGVSHAGVEGRRAPGWEAAELARSVITAGAQRTLEVSLHTCGRRAG